MRTFLHSSKFHFVFNGILWFFFPFGLEILVDSLCSLLENGYCMLHAKKHEQSNKISNNLTKKYTAVSIFHGGLMGSFCSIFYFNCCWLSFLKPASGYWCTKAKLFRKELVGISFGAPCSFLKGEFTYNSYSNTILETFHSEASRIFLPFCISI